MTPQASADRDAAPAPVAPATIVRVLVRPLTKVLNPLMVRLAGRRFFPMAQIHHVGRRSGKAYVTPTSAHIRGDRCRRLRAPPHRVGCRPESPEHPASSAAALTCGDCTRRYGRSISR